MACIKGHLVSPLLFVTVMDVLIEDVGDGSLMEMYAEDLAPCGESLDEVMGKCEKWKSVLKGQGLRLNVEETKGMQLLYGRNSIWCVYCHKCVHLPWSDMP